MKILVIFTGGTIGCAPPDNENRLNVELKRLNASWRDYYLLTSYTGRADSDQGVEFDTLEPMGILSENMTVTHWYALVETLRGVDFERYSGIIVTHGTDTLAYTAAFLGILFCGAKIPIILVSSDKSLYDEEANGHQNFTAAVGYIKGGGKPGVYAAFSYGKDETIVYMGTRIMQSLAFSDKYGSGGGMNFGYIKDDIFLKTWRHGTIESKPDNPALHKLKGLKPRVILISPYVGLDYTRIMLDPKETGAVLHTTYHSFTANAGEKEYASVLALQRECAERGILLAVAPFSKKILSGGARYDTSDKMLRAGIFPMCGQTVECAYAKLLIAANLYGNVQGIKSFASKTYFFEDFENDIDNRL